MRFYGNNNNNNNIISPLTPGAASMLAGRRHRAERTRRIVAHGDAMARAVYSRDAKAGAAALVGGASISLTPWWACVGVCDQGRGAE